MSSIAPTGSTPPRVGIVGGGQLARMLAEAASPLGIAVTVLAGEGDEGVRGVVADVLTGSPDDPAALARLASEVDVVTFDHENVDLDAVDALVADGVAVRPGPETLRYADKAHQRRMLSDADLPVPPFVVVDPVGESSGGSADVGGAVADAVSFVQAYGPDVIVKASRGGYDGRAVFRVSGVDEVTAFVSGWRAAPLVIEPALDLDREVAVLVARTPSGDVEVYPVLETVQRDGMCNEVAFPVSLPAPILEAALTVGTRVADVVDAIGVLAIELFVTTSGEVLVNELAPRVHNSGHLTVDACVTGQFEQHLRAVLDLPLGDPTPRARAAAMVNVVGSDPVAGGGSGALAEPRARLARGLAVDAEARVHLYGKTPRPGRKIGHVTVCSDDLADATDRATAVARSLDGGGDP